MTGTGETVIANGATLNIDGASTKGLNQRTVNLTGLATWRGAGSVELRDGPTLNVAAGGVFDAQTDAGWVYAGGVLTPSVNVVAGAALKKTAGTGTTTFAAALNNSGTVEVQVGTLAVVGGTSGGIFDVQAGSTLRFIAGALISTSTLTAGSRVAGAGNVRFDHPSFNNIVNVNGTYAITGTTTVDGGTIVNFNSDTAETAVLAVIGGNVSGSGQIIARSAFSWIAGALIGTGTTAIGPGAQGSISGASTKILTTRTLSNAGTTAWTGSGPINGNSEGKLVNLDGGVFDIQTDAPFTWSSGTMPVIANEAGALFKKSAGAGTSSIRAQFVNAGRLDLTGAQPGVGPIALATNASFRQTDNGTLGVRLGGSPACPAFDHLSVADVATLGGGIDVTLLDGCVPALGQSFVVVSAAAVSGRFALLEGVPATHSMLYSPTTASIGSPPDAIACSAPAGAVSGVFLLGPCPYLSQTNSPFDLSGLGSTFFLEDFEDRALNVPGVAASSGGASSNTCCPGLHDSVDADDGAIDGSGLAGESWFSSTPIRFTFDAAALGGLPSRAGTVYTDTGVGGSITFEAFGPAGQSLGLIGPVFIADNSNTGRRRRTASSG